MRFKLKISKIWQLLVSIFALLVVLENRSVYQVALNIDFHLEELTLVSLFIVLAVGLKSKQLRITMKTFSLGAFVLVYCLFFLLINVLRTNNRYTYIYHFMIFLPLLVIVESSSKKSFTRMIIEKYSKVMVFLAIASLVFWIFGSILGIIQSTSIFSYIWGVEQHKRSFYGLYFETYKDTFLFLNIYRNGGIFAEPPMYSMNLSIALLYRYFLDENNRGTLISWQNIILMSTIGSCISFTGLGIIAIILIYHVLRVDRKNRNKVVLKITGIVLGLWPVSYLMQLIEMKFSTVSSNIRLDDYIIGFKAWRRSPIFGGGYGVRTYQKYIGDWRGTNIGFSNSIMWILSQGGIYLFLIYLIPLLMSIFANIKNKKWSETIFSASILYLWITTSFAYHYISLIMIVFFIFEAKSLYRRPYNH